MRLVRFLFIWIIMLVIVFIGSILLSFVSEQWGDDGAIGIVLVLITLLISLMINDWSD